jgi:hypothetical protein
MKPRSGIRYIREAEAFLCACEQSNTEGESCRPRMRRRGDPWLVLELCILCRPPRAPDTEEQEDGTDLSKAKNPIACGAVWGRY